MTRTGIVESLRDGEVTVVLADASCDGCSTPCGACNRRQKPQVITLQSELALSVGDRVEIELRSSAVVWYSLSLFVLPILCGVSLCLVLMPLLGEAMGALLSALGALLLFFAVGAVLAAPALRQKNAPILTRILAKNGEEKELDKP